MLYYWPIQPYISFLWLKLGTHFVTKATPIHYIDNKGPCTVLLVMYSAQDFCCFINGQYSLTLVSLAIIRDTFHYLHHAQALYQWQEP